MGDKNMTIPIANGQYIGSINIVGSPASVEAMMEEVRKIIYERLHIQAIENHIPANGRPGPCGGCGDN